MAQVPIEERCQQLREVLKGTGRVALTYVDTPIWEPIAGSEGETELHNAETGPAGLWGEPPVRTAYALANAGITAVLDQLSALEILTQPVAPALATTVVARSAIEIGSGVWWLMEPRIGARRRVARCGAEEMESALRANQAATKLGGGPDLQEYLDQETRVRARLTGLGLAVTGGGFSPSVDGEKRPDATTLTTDCLGQILDHGSVVVYNVYSAITHGTLYGLMQHFVEDPTDPTKLTWTSSLPVMEASVQVALVACLLSVDRIIEVMGWDPTAWNDWKPDVGGAFP
jgi:hypothetical protein